MAKQVLYGQRARRALMGGVDATAHACGATLGPNGRNVLVRNKYTGLAFQAYDGATVAKEINLHDPFLNMGVRLIHDAAEKVCKQEGDGSATMAILAWSMFRQGMVSLAAGANPVAIRSGMEKGLERLLAEIKAGARPVETMDQMVHVATAAAGDAQIGRLVGEAHCNVQPEGVVFVEESSRNQLEVEYVKGWYWDRGIVSRHFINKPEGNEAVVEEPWILLTDGKIRSIDQILPTLKALTPVERRNLVVVCDDAEGQALSVLVSNNANGLFTCAVVKPPGYDYRRREMLQDIAVLTGGQVLSEELGRSLNKVTLSDLGRARRVVANEKRTIIIEGRGTAESVEERIKLIHGGIDAAFYEYDKQKYRERIARLRGQLALLKVGGLTAFELKRRLHLVERAQKALKAATDTGMVVGGGLALLNAADALSDVQAKGDEAIGLAIVKRALEEPIRWLGQNNGHTGSTIVGRVKGRQALDGNRWVGYDALADEIADLEERGVYDPVGVVSTALSSAVSAAAILLTAEAAVAWIPGTEPKPEPVKKAGPPPPQMPRMTPDGDILGW